MGLREILSDAAVKGVAALGNAADDINYYQVSVGGYDVSLDSNVSTETLIQCKGVLYKSKIETQDYKRTDLEETKVLITGKVFADAGVTPDEQDYMIIGGVRYEIKNIRPAPTQAIWVFVVRAV